MNYSWPNLCLLWASSIDTSSLQGPFSLCIFFYPIVSIATNCTTSSLIMESLTKLMETFWNLSINGYVQETIKTMLQCFSDLLANWLYLIFLSFKFSLTVSFFIVYFTTSNYTEICLKICMKSMLQSPLSHPK